MISPRKYARPLLLIALLGLGAARFLHLVGGPTCEEIALLQNQRPLRLESLSAIQNQKHHSCK
jgi:hypothetical protein